jgi:hypothetical protein
MFRHWPIFAAVNLTMPIRMLTTEEKDFIHYWETNRVRRKKIFRQFLIGIPIGLLFVIPIVINFASGWYKRAQMESNSQEFNPMVLFFALLVIVIFTAIFYQQHRWDRYEQRYRELLARQTRDDPAPPSTDDLAPPSSDNPASPSTDNPAPPTAGEPAPPSAGASSPVPDRVCPPGKPLPTGQPADPPVKTGEN